MYFIIDYSIADVAEILKVLNVNSIDEDMFRNTKHINESNNKRFNNINLIYNLITDYENVGILKSNYNLFKIYYNHPSKKSKDVCIVISINDNKGVKLITAYISPKEKRVRSYER